MCDKLVFDLSQEIEGSPSVFIRKDWISMLDNQNQNYNSNQSIIDTSQICNSNKYMSYRESYLSIPLTLTLGLTQTTYSAGVNAPNIVIPDPTLSNTSYDYTIGLKNWFGQIIHSFTLDYNGTTIIQQTPYVNMWNSFKLMTSLSLDDVNVQGPTIGFFPDDALSFQYIAPVLNANTGLVGNGTCNNSNLNTILLPTGQFNNFRSGSGNEGFIVRQQLINFDVQGSIGQNTVGTGLAAGLYQSTQYFGNLLFGGDAPIGTAQGNIINNAFGGRNALNTLWKGYIYNKVAGGINGGSMYQVAVVATVYLKHIHSFFNFCPLIKGAFMKMTMNLNNTTTEFCNASIAGDAVPATGLISVQSVVKSIQNPLGGVNPIMIASGSNIPATLTGAGTTFTQQNGGWSLLPRGSNNAAATAANTAVFTYRLNISVGAFCLDQALGALAGQATAPLSRSIYLYIPSYTFNPPFEQAYLSNPVKNIKYTDIYQYQVQNIAPQQTYSNLITNGIANIKSVLILPFYSSATGANNTTSIGTIAPAIATMSQNTGFLTGTPVWQSPYDPAGTGPTSPLTYLGNFNIQISGQNAIYNTEKYNFEQYNNQLYGYNAVNGGMTDGLNSGLVSRQAFDMCYNYYYVNVERMLPAEQSVPKSVQIIGQNLSSKALDFIVFVEFGVDTISIDILTGARV